MSRPAPTALVSARRLGAGDLPLARATFRLMAEVFETEWEEPSDDYLRRLLARDDRCAFAGFVGDTLAGGLTAHAIPMTTAEQCELLIWDLAVHPDQQRRGVGTALVEAARVAATELGIAMVFVAAENADGHAVEFYQAIGGTPLATTFFSWRAAR